MPEHVLGVFFHRVSGTISNRQTHLDGVGHVLRRKLQLIALRKVLLDAMMAPGSDRRTQSD